MEDHGDKAALAHQYAQRGVNDAIVKYWKHDMKGMKMICDFQVHREPLSTVAMSVDNLWVFSSSHDSKLRMYSMEEMRLGKLKMQLQLKQFKIETN